LKIVATLYKEFLLLVRDPGGMTLLFLMPLALVIVMALVQDAPFRDYQEIKLDVLFADLDHDSLGVRIQQAFHASPNINLVENNDTAVVNDLVHSGEFKAAIILPVDASKTLRQKSIRVIDDVLVNAGLAVESPRPAELTEIRIRILFDPVIKANYKQVLSGAIEEILTGIQAEWILDELQDQLSENRPQTKKVKPDLSGLVRIEQTYASQNATAELELNSVQHNVPAWTMFAMFFILYPLAGNYIKEREEGSLLRLRLISGSELPVVTGKFAFYFGICLLQFVLMILVGIYVMPWLGLKSLILGNNVPGIIITACSVAIAATGYGTLIAVFFKTTQQALSFGSISVVILSAFGGVWVPVYVLPEVLQQVSRFSPLNWGLESFNDLFLRDAETILILPNLLKLIIFGAVTLMASIFINKSRTVS
jgi:ABC-2 type transport system permease protein